MTEFAKIFSSLLLLTAGFVGASLFGPPELVDQLASRLSIAPQQDPQALRPLPPGAATTEAPGWETSKPSPYANRPNQVETASWPNNVPTESSAKVTQAGGAASDEWFHSATDWMNGQQAPSVQTTAQRAPLSPVRRAKESSIASANSEQPLTSFPALTSEGKGPQQHVAAKPSEGTTWDRPSWDIASMDDIAARRPDASEKSLEDNPWLTGVESQSSENRVGAFPALPLTNAATIQENFAAKDFGDYREPAAEWTDYESYENRNQQPVARAKSEGHFHEHVVTDGDTLPLLAQRYLGDPSRAQELFEVNRDRLEHPDLLPIGLVLRAPAVSVRASQKSTTNKAVSAWPKTAATTPFAPISTQENSFMSAQPATPTLSPGPLRPLGEPIESYSDNLSASSFENGSVPTHASELAW